MGNSSKKDSTGASILKVEPGWDAIFFIGRRRIRQLVKSEWPQGECAD